MLSAADIPKRHRTVAIPAHRIAAGLVVLYIALAAWWSTMVPLGEGPDEPGHFDYALFVAREGRLPLQTGGAGEVPGEGHQPPLAYWLMQPALAWLPPDELTLEMGPNPQFLPAGGEANAYLRSSRDIWPYSGVGRAWHLARAISALLGGATVGLTYAVARRCAPQDPLIALGAAALVAFNPQFVFAGALVSNDPLLFTLAAALLLVCVVIADTPQVLSRSSLALAALAGGLLGLLLITKQSAVALVPLPFLALVLGGWRGRARSAHGGQDAHGGAGRGHARGAERGHAAGAQRLWHVATARALVVAGVAAAIAGWWYARNLRLYGDLFGLEAFRETFVPGGANAISGLPAGLWQLFRSSWGVFGWLSVPLNYGYHSAMLVYATLALIGLLAAGGVSHRMRRGATDADTPPAQGAGYAAGVSERMQRISSDADMPPAQGAFGVSLRDATHHDGYGHAPAQGAFGVSLLAACVGLVFAWTAAFAVVAGPVAWQGRFLFAAVAALATGMSAGLAAVLPRRSALWTLLALLALVSLTTPGGVIALRYPTFVMPPQPTGWGNTSARLSLPWKRGVELRNAEFPDRVAAGQALPVTLTWHALEQLDADYLVFVHLVDAGGNVVAETNLPPRDGRFPTSSWVRGDWIEQTQQLSLAGVAPGRYDLYAGLWDSDADRTLPVVGDDGVVADWRHFIGAVEVTKE